MNRELYIKEALKLTNMSKAKLARLPTEMIRVILEKKMKELHRRQQRKKQVHEDEKENEKASEVFFNPSHHIDETGPLSGSKPAEEEESLIDFPFPMKSVHEQGEKENKGEKVENKNDGNEHGADIEQCIDEKFVRLEQLEVMEVELKKWLEELDRIQVRLLNQNQLENDFKMVMQKKKMEWSRSLISVAQEKMTLGMDVCDKVRLMIGEYNNILHFFPDQEMHRFLATKIDRLHLYLHRLQTSGILVFPK